MFFIRAELREYHVDLKWYSLIGIEEEFLGDNSEVLTKGEDDRAYSVSPILGSPLLGESARFSLHPLQLLS